MLRKNNLIIEISDMFDNNYEIIDKDNEWLMVFDADECIIDIKGCRFYLSELEELLNVLQNIVRYNHNIEYANDMIDSIIEEFNLSKDGRK